MKVSAADIDGDGSDELVVGTSQRQLAAYDAQGKQLWLKDYDSDILRMATADLDGEGKAQAIAYLMTERMHRVTGEGKELEGGDVLEAERKMSNGAWGVAGGSSLGIWAPDGEKKKEIIETSEWSYRVRFDGSVVGCGRLNQPLGCGRLVNFLPGEPEVLVTVGGRDVNLWSARRDKNGNYTHLAGKPEVSGPDGGALAWTQQVDAGGMKGFLAAYQGGLNYYPVEAFAPNSKVTGWEFSSGGVPAVAALTADVAGSGTPQVFMGRLDGFVNVLKLADGGELALINVGEPIVGMAAVKGKGGKTLLAVGTKFGVHLFGADFKLIGSHKLAAPRPASPGRAERTRIACTWWTPPAM